MLEVARTTVHTQTRTTLELTQESPEQSSDTRDAHWQPLLGHQTMEFIGETPVLASICCRVPRQSSWCGKSERQV
eukprot:2310668-Amphidinium_carterae.1